MLQVDPGTLRPSSTSRMSETSFPSRACDHLETSLMPQERRPHQSDEYGRGPLVSAVWTGCGKKVLIRFRGQNHRPLSRLEDLQGTLRNSPVTGSKTFRI